MQLKGVKAVVPLSAGHSKATAHETILMGPYHVLIPIETFCHLLSAGAIKL